MTARRQVLCPRCNGAGGWAGWPGFTCYRCHGSGHVVEPRARKTIPSPEVPDPAPAPPVATVPAWDGTITEGTPKQIAWAMDLLDGLRVNLERRGLDPLKIVPQMYGAPQRASTYIEDREYLQEMRG